MRAALIANVDDADPGFVGRALRRRGVSFVEYLREHMGVRFSPPPPSLLKCLNA